uniref:Uncharacterized protein n=1 Tax=Pfiesteria piscicida TaxID=71001 RepID=A3E3U2_PFIPI|nr:unknown [Pfiesteria piscicida]ABI14360.1 unknown [Pfiesteria piscicida]
MGWRRDAVGCWLRFPRLLRRVLRLCTCREACLHQYTLVVARAFPELEEHR